MSTKRKRWTTRWRTRPRAGAAAVDVVLILGVILPLAGLMIGLGAHIMRVVHEMICVLVSWPFI